MRAIIIAAAVLSLLAPTPTAQAQDLPADAIAISPTDALALNLGRLYRLSSWQPGFPPLPPGVLFSIPGMEENGGLTNAVYFSPSAAALFVDDRAAVAAQMLAEAGSNQNQLILQEEEGGEMGEGYTGGLWLEPVQGVSNVFNVLLHGATNGSYYLITSTEYLDPATNCTWFVEGSLQGTDDPTPFAVGISLRTNNLFIRAQACDDVCAATNLPLAWQLSYFGATGVDPLGDYDGDGVNNLTEFLNGSDPNKITFSLSVTNQYVAAESVPVQLNIAGGVPSYIALLVNDTNTAGGSWQPFASTSLSVPTVTDGTCVITVGLCGLATNATPSWQTLTVFRDSTPLGIGLTNLASFSGFRPFIDPAGYATRSLSALTWTVVDATGATNTGNGTLTAQDWGLSDRWHTTNWLQCPDLALALGTNWISIQAVDWAGSVAITNFQYIFDTNGDTTPPALTLAWPPDGTHVSGASFTGQAWMDDDTASVALQYTDGDGIVQTVNGIVERGGNVWLPGVPLGAGTNHLSVFATDAAGNVSTNSFIVVQSTTTITINPISGDLLNYAYATIDVYVSDPATSVTINGVSATEMGFGVWEAANVPLPPGGSVTLLAVAHLASGDTVQALLKLERGPIVFTQNYGYKLDYSLYDWAMDGTNCLSTHQIELQWARGAGGTNTQADAWLAPDGTVVSSNYLVVVWPPDNGYWPFLSGQSSSATYTNGVLTYATNWTVGPPGVEWMEKSTSVGNWPDYFQANWSESSARDVRLLKGGDAVRQGQDLFDLNASLTAESVVDRGVYDWYLVYPGLAFRAFLAGDTPPVVIPSQQITLGSLGALGSDGHLYTAQSSGGEVVVTPKAPMTSYTGPLPGATKYHPYITLSTATTNANLDIATPEICVGQQVTLALNGLPFYQQQVGHWTLPQKYVNEAWQRTQWVVITPPSGYWTPYGSVNYRINSDLLTNLTTQCWYVNKPGGRVTAAWNLQFANGQQLIVMARGSFTVYRPTANITEVDFPRNYVLTETNILYSKLQLGESDGTGNFRYRVEAHTTRPFIGDCNISQLVTADYSFPVYQFTDERADGGEFYVSAAARVIDTAPIDLDDGPFERWESPNIVSLSARDFVRFLPDGAGSIWVTLGITRWETVGIAEQDIWTNWSITSAATQGPDGLDSSDELPVWTSTVSTR